MDGQTITTNGKVGFFNFMYNIHYMIHISSVQSPHMSRFLIKYKINNKSVCASHVHVSHSRAGWSSAFLFLKECVWLWLEPVSYTYHSLKLEESALCPLELCTTEAGDKVVLLWVSVVGDTRPGGVDDS